MDRGMIKIEGMTLSEYREHVLERVLPSSPLASVVLPSQMLLGVMRRLRHLTLNWMRGLSFADTVLTCLSIQRIWHLRDPILAWYVKATFYSCQMLSDLLIAAQVVRGDEYYTNLYGMADMRLDPNAESTLDWHNAQSVQIRCTHGTGVWSECQRLALWITLLRMLRLGLFDYEHIKRLISQIRQLSFPLDAEIIVTEREMLIEPLLANHFSSGCVRKPVELVDLETCETLFDKTLFKFEELLNFFSRRPLFKDLFVKTLAASTETLPHYSPILFTLIFVSLLIVVSSLSFPFFSHALSKEIPFMGTLLLASMDVFPLGWIVIHFVPLNLS